MKKFTKKTRAKVKILTFPHSPVYFPSVKSPTISERKFYYCLSKSPETKSNQTEVSLKRILKTPSITDIGTEKFEGEFTSSKSFKLYKTSNSIQTTQAYNIEHKNYNYPESSKNYRKPQNSEKKRIYKLNRDLSALKRIEKKIKEYNNSNKFYQYL